MKEALWEARPLEALTRFGPSLGGQVFHLDLHPGLTTPTWSKVTKQRHDVLRERALSLAHPQLGPIPLLFLSLLTPFPPSLSSRPPTPFGKRRFNSTPLFLFSSSRSQDPLKLVNFSQRERLTILEQGLRDARVGVPPRRTLATLFDVCPSNIELFRSYCLLGTL